MIIRSPFLTTCKACFGDLQTDLYNPQVTVCKPFDCAWLFGQSATVFGCTRNEFPDTWKVLAIALRRYRLQVSRRVQTVALPGISSFPKVLAAEFQKSSSCSSSSEVFITNFSYKYSQSAVEIWRETAGTVSQTVSHFELLYVLRLDSEESVIIDEK